MSAQMFTRTNIVLRTGINIFNKFLKKQEVNISPSCIKRITSNNYAELASMFEQPPMFSRYYLIYATYSEYDRKYQEYLIALSRCKWIHIVVEINNRTLYDQLQCDINFRDFLFLNCYGLTSDIYKRYITEELLRYGAASQLVTADAVKQIYKRIRFKEHTLDSVLPILANTDLKKKTINSYIAPYSGVTLQNFGSKIFDTSKSKPVGQMLYRYRNYIDPLFSSVKEYINTWFILYDEYASGALCEDTLLIWLENNGKKYKLVYEYQVKNWLTAFHNYSYEFMSVMFVLIQNTPKTNNAQFITLIKLFKAVNCS